MLLKNVFPLALTGVFVAGMATAGDTVHEVTIYDDDFMPPLVYAHPGDTVRFLNEDEEIRQATAVDASWTTGDLAPGDSFEIALTAGMELSYVSAYNTESIGAVTFEVVAE